MCGPLVGGAFVAQAVAEHLGAAFCWSSRVAGTYEVPAALRPALAGRRVAIVDDAINAGSAVLGSATAVRAAGGRLVAVGALVAVGDATSVLDVPLEHLATIPSHLWPPGSCPLCAAGAPVDRPPL